MRILLPLCLAVASAIPAYNLSGTVTDPLGHGVAGVWVGLAQAKIATKTASDGTWSINGVSGIASRSVATRTELANHLTLDRGRLKLSLSGTDIAGRSVSGVRTGSIPALAGARKSETVTDTLLFGGSSTLLASEAVAQADLHGIQTIVDTVETFSYRIASDTFITTYSSDFWLDCRGNSLDIFHSQEYSDTMTYDPTASGFELLSSHGNYVTALKFSRTSGSGGSLPGTYALVGRVYRPTEAVPDSILRILADDSASTSRIYTTEQVSYSFSNSVVHRVWAHPLAPGRQLLLGWSNSFMRWIYLESSDTWVDEATVSDSARYDIAVSLVDSSTVRLVGAKTSETVTVVGAKGPFGSNDDYTYSSSDPSHGAATSYNMPTTCPNGPAWLSLFMSDNFRTTAAARKLAGTARTPQRTSLSWFPKRHQ